MKLGLDTLRDPTQVLTTWKRLVQRPFGKQLFSRAIGLMAPYTGTIGAQVIELAPGYARVQMRDRWGVRNHLKSVHAVALMNLGEECTGLAAMSLVPAGGRGIVLELSMEYLKKARGTITAESRAEMPTAPGSHDVDVCGELKNSVGEVVSRVRARWRVQIPGVAVGDAAEAATAEAAEAGASEAGASEVGASEAGATEAGATDEA